MHLGAKVALLSPAACPLPSPAACRAAGYDAGTASRGGGSGGTTEAMTGGVAAGSGLGDERRAGMGELERGQM